MKKLVMIFAFCMVLTLSTSLKPAFIHANSMDANSKVEFLNALNKQLSNTVHYYRQDSVQLIDGLDLQGKVVKVVKKDNPGTKENEEVTEEYTSHLAVAFVELEQVRDSLWAFKKTDFYYYDLDKKEFLTSSNVLMNGEVKSFFDSYVQNIDKSMTPFSQVLFMFFLSLIIIVPLLIMIFHNKGRSTSTNIYY
ncbi:hypothetical protein BGM26_17505 [Bacillus sp. FJAT-29790]|uniref:hypothetical protein n=1 Tax=Bacillus sp. FJAT-29790 TaxID=1895002 RepID=UPI001C210851|nr:hypothetical protein [Bacillus sp. FJAT-29790]MBU8880751.1 hypothetical protein [Bacillus sp. FJAT-29790]